jgi:hypothetical protein
VSFAGGPLVIPASYAANMTSVLAKFPDVVVYILDEEVTIDVRHILITRPKAIISNLSTYASTLTAVFTAAGLVSGTHFVAVNQTASSAVVSSLDQNSCYTMVAEPHYGTLALLPCPVAVALHALTWIAPRPSLQSLTSPPRRT